MEPGAAAPGLHMSEEKKSISFLTGTWHEVLIPESKADQPGYSPEEIYDAFWEGELPEGVEVIEGEVSHIWDDELK